MNTKNNNILFNHYRFKKSSRAKELNAAVKSFPQNWRLIPVEEKIPKLRNWQNSQYSRDEILAFINNGYQLTSKKSGKNYTAYPSGISILSGEASGGVLLIDFDGPSATKIWETMGGESAIASQTRTHSSGKKGRKQVWLQIPGSHRVLLENFSRHVVTAWGEEKAESGELLEFRYNLCQSVLPPSLHPETGRYEWVNEGPIAICPPWLLSILVSWAQGQKTEAEAKIKAKAQREKIKAERLEAWRAKQQQNTEKRQERDEDINLTDFLEFEVLPRLSPTQIYNHPGHNWIYIGKERMEGAPVWRESSSGRSVHVNLSNCSWYDFGLQIGGGPIQYRWILNGGIPGTTPRGEDFLKIAKGLADDAGLELPQPEKRRKQFSFEIKPSQAQQEYHRLKKFTPTETIDQQYLSAIFPESNEREIIAIKSPMGTGKTELVKLIRETFKKNGGIILGSRNSLLIQTAERIGAYHLHQDEAYFLTSDRYSWIANCVDSLHRWEDDHFDDRILILDEWASTIKHLLVGSTIFKRRSLIVNKLVEAVRRAKYIIILDGNLKDSDFEYLQKLSGIQKYRKILNEYEGAKREIDFCLGSVDSKGEHPNDYRSLTEWIFTNHNRIGIISDSQKECEAIHRKLIDKGLDDKYIIRIDSKTVTEDFAKEFLKDPVKYINNNHIRIVILSPSAESGLDINLKDYFTDLYFFRFHIDTETALQMLNRFRDPEIKWHIWSKTYLSLQDEGFNSPFARKVYQQILEFVDRDLELLSDKEAIAKLKAIIKDNTDKTHLEAIAKINSLLNYDRANLRDTLLEELERQGHSIKKGWIEKEKSNLKEYRQQILKETAEIIFNAEDIDIKEAEEISNSWTANWKDKCKAEKSLLINRILPGITDSPIWSPQLIEKIKSDRYMIRRLGLRYLYERPDIARKIQEEKWDRLLEAANPNFFPSDWRSPLLIIQTLKDVGLDTILDPYRIWDGTERELIQICNLAGYYKRRWLFGKQGGLSKIQFINRRILGYLGYKLARRRCRVNGELITEYQLQDLYETLEFDGKRFPLAEEIEKAIGVRYEEPMSVPAASNRDNNKEAEGSPSASAVSMDFTPSTPQPSPPAGDDLYKIAFQRKIKVGDRVRLKVGGYAEVVNTGNNGYLQIKDASGYWHSSIHAVVEVG